MSAGHSLRRESYTFTRFDARARDLGDPSQGPRPGPLAVTITVIATATCCFLAMDATAASWAGRALLALLRLWTG
jgi:hypothetical protein